MKKLIASVSLFALPLIASAQSLTPLYNLVANIGRLVAMLVPIAITVALLAFFWGLIKYVWGGTKSDHTKGRNTMIWGLIAIFVMVSVWGIIGLAQTALGVNPNASVQSPGVPVPRN